jgi:hypothetical protein
MTKFALILLTGMAFAQEKPAAKLPEVPLDYQSKFKTLVIKQKDLQIDELSLQQRYAADVKAADQVNADGQTLEAKLLADLKLDPKKYTVSYKEDKMQIVEKK